MGVGQVTAKRTIIYKKTVFIMNYIFSSLSKLLAFFSKLIKSDKLYISIDYFFATRKRLKLSPPVTFNEKLQWLKLNDKHPEYTHLVDKSEVKEIVKI
ncbi:hypothetical protein DWY45_01495 [Phocaeicola plebeius]|nr:hypothetical protein DWY45_01495 [Phocaeicola plebeius]